MKDRGNYHLSTRVVPFYKCTYLGTYLLLGVTKILQLKHIEPTQFLAEIGKVQVKIAVVSGNKRCDLNAKKL